MDGNRSKQYKRYFPEIDLTKDQLSHDEIKMIVSRYIPDINWEASKMIDFLNTINPKFETALFYRNSMYKIINPENKLGGSTRSLNYWISRGWDKEYAVQKVKEIQSKNSSRTKLYWTSRGYDDITATEKVKEVQANNARLLREKAKENNTSHLLSIWKYQYWMAKGLSFAESVEKVSGIQRVNSLRGAAKITPEQRRLINPVFIDYWQARYPNSDYKTMFQDYCAQRYKSQAFRSKIADEFCVNLASNFTNAKLYYGENEYGKYIPLINSYVKYDYIDLTNNFCVEFNGNYWHRNSQEKDKIKKEFIESLGFKYIVIWESDYIKDKSSTINRVITIINNGI